MKDWDVFLNVLRDGIGEVQLVQALGDDAMIARAAWVSRADDGRGADPEKVERVIRYMLGHNHGTPFEHNLLTFRVVAPIFVFREWHRHRIGWSYNEESRRYVDAEKSPPRFYVPETMRGRSATNKQGSETNSSLNQQGARFLLMESNEAALEDYKELLDGGIAPEQARLVLPVSLYSTMYASCNLRSLWAFLKLRQSPDAQWEIRQYASALAMLAEGVFPVAMRAWRELFES